VAGTLTGQFAPLTLMVTPVAVELIGAALVTLMNGAGAPIVVVVKTAGAPGWSEALSGRVVCVAFGHVGGVPVAATPSHVGGVPVGANNATLGHPTIFAETGEPKSVILAEVSNSNWDQFKAVPTAPDAVSVTVTVGVVSVAPASIGVLPVETSRYGNVGFGPPKPEKTPPVVLRAALLCAVHPVWPAAVHKVMTSGALPEAGAPVPVPPVQVSGPEAAVLT
jgi:hypothetical protein